MTTISEAELARIVDGIVQERHSIVKHNPIGKPEEILLWMLLGCLISYLNLSDIETPCFTGRPNADTYRDAIGFVLKSRRSDEFEPDAQLARLSEPSA